MGSRIMKHFGSFVMSIIFIVLGILAFAVPAVFTGTLVWIIGAILITAGVFYMVFALFYRRFLFGLTWIFFEGIFTTIMGIVIVSYPQGSFRFLTYVFAVWLMLSGFTQFFSSFDLRKYSPRFWWISIIIGCIYVALSILIFAYPKEFEDAIRIILGVSLLTFGVLRIVDLLGVFSEPIKVEPPVNDMKKAIKEQNDHIDIDYTK